MGSSGGGEEVQKKKLVSLTAATPTPQEEPPPPEKISNQYEYLITEIEGSDSFIASTIREVFESDRPEDHVAFQHGLDKRIKHHSSKIEKMCFANYSSFNRSVSQLVHLNANMSEFSCNVQSISTQADHALQVAMKHETGLQKTARSFVNVQKTRAALRNCLPVLHMHAKMLQRLHDPAMHYHALKLIDEILSDALPLVDSQRFRESLHKDLLARKAFIRDTTRDCFKSYLESVWSNAGKIGCLAMQIMQHTRKNQLALSHKSPKKSSGPTRAFKYDVAVQESCVDPEAFIDFKLLFKCQLIFSALGEEEIFHHKYQLDRKDQLTKLMQQRMGKKCTKESLCELLERLIGFFIIEEHVLCTNCHLVCWDTLSDSSVSAPGWWEEAVQALETLLLLETPNLQLADDVLVLKDVVVLFCAVANSYSFSSQRLESLAYEMREHYVRRLNDTLIQRFITIFWKDSYSPMVLRDRMELSLAQSLVNPLDEVGTGQLGVGSSVQFSECVPKTYRALKEYVNCLRHFCAGLELTDQVKEDFMRGCLNDLVKEHLNGVIVTVIGSREERATKAMYLPPAGSSIRGTLDLHQLVQIIANCSFLERCCEHVERAISYHPDPSWQPLRPRPVKLLAGAVFKDITDQIATRLRDYIKEKIDQMIEMEYDWTSETAVQPPSDYITELTCYLRDNFTIHLASLPPAVAVTTFMEACQYIAKLLRACLFCAPEISTNFLKLFSDDVATLEKFTSELSFAPEECEMFRAAFLDLRQLLDCIINEQCYVLIHDARSGVSGGRFARVVLRDVAVLLERLRVHEANRPGRALFSRGNERDRRIKYLETTIREIHSLL